MKKIKLVLLSGALTISLLKAQFYDNTYPVQHNIVTKRVAHQNIVSLGKKGCIVINTLQNNNTLLTHLDDEGFLVWSKQYYLGGEINIKGGVITDDGNILTLGDNPALGKSKGLLIKIDASNGDLIWNAVYHFESKELGELELGELYTLCRSNEADESYFITGTKTTVKGSGSRNYMFVMKIKGIDGSVIWGKEYTDPGRSTIDDVDRPLFIGENPLAPAAGEILIMGTRGHAGLNDYIFSVVIDNSGSILQKYKEFHFAFNDNSSSPHVSFDSNGDCLVVFQAYLAVGAVKLSRPAYSPDWKYYYQFPSFLENISGAASAVNQNGFNISGCGYDEDTHTKYPFMFRIDKTGDPVWGKIYLKPSTFNHISMVQTSASEFLIQSAGGKSEFSMIKTDLNGEKTPCFIAELPSKMSVNVEQQARAYVSRGAVPVTDQADIKLSEDLSEIIDCTGTAKKKTDCHRN
jgi:hypothetical protein